MMDDLRAKSVPCRTCGVSILETTAQQLRGRCHPCARKTLHLRVGTAFRSAASFLLTPILFPIFLVQEWLRYRRRPRWPTTVDEAVRFLSRSENLEYARNFTTADDFVSDQYFGLGLSVRNSMGLWQGNTELLTACGADDPDEASSRILEALWRAANSER